MAVTKLLKLLALFVVVSAVAATCNTADCAAAIEGKTEVIKQEPKQDGEDCYYLCHLDSCYRDCSNVEARATPEELNGALVIYEKYIDAPVIINDSELGYDDLCYWWCSISGCIHICADDVAAKIGALSKGDGDIQKATYCAWMCGRWGCTRICSRGGTGEVDAATNEDLNTPEETGIPTCWENCAAPPRRLYCWTVCYPPFNEW